MNTNIAKKQGQEKTKARSNNTRDRKRWHRQKTFGASLPLKGTCSTGKNKINKSGKTAKEKSDEDKTKDKATGHEGGFNRFDRLLQGHFLHGLRQDKTRQDKTIIK